MPNIFSFLSNLFYKKTETDSNVEANEFNLIVEILNNTNKKIILQKYNFNDNDIFSNINNIINIIYEQSLIYGFENLKFKIGNNIIEPSVLGLLNLKEYYLFQLNFIPIREKLIKSINLITNELKVNKRYKLFDLNIISENIDPSIIKDWLLKNIDYKLVFPECYISNAHYQNISKLIEFGKKINFDIKVEEYQNYKEEKIKSAILKRVQNFKKISASKKEKYGNNLKNEIIYLQSGLRIFLENKKVFINFSKADILNRIYNNQFIPEADKLIRESLNKEDYEKEKDYNEKVIARYNSPNYNKPVNDLPIETGDFGTKNSVMEVGKRKGYRTPINYRK